MAAGLGLSLLIELCKLNRGKLEIYSHDSYTFLAKDKMNSHSTAKYYFPGTVINIELRNDDNFYYLKTEDISSPESSIF